MASAHHRHQDSLERLLKFSPSPPLELNKSIQARDRFYEILQHYENTPSIPNGPYNRLKLLRTTYDYAISEKSKDNVLRAFFNAVGLSMDEQDGLNFSTKEVEDEIFSKLVGFADFLIDNFFLPCKLSEAPLFLSTVTDPYQ
jgi:hypothetical protein